MDPAAPTLHAGPETLVKEQVVRQIGADSEQMGVEVTGDCHWGKKKVKGHQTDKKGSVRGRKERSPGDT